MDKKIPGMILGIFLFHLDLLLDLLKVNPFTLYTFKSQQPISKCLENNALQSFF